MQGHRGVIFKCLKTRGTSFTRTNLEVTVSELTLFERDNDLIVTQMDQSKSEASCLPSGTTCSGSSAFPPSNTIDGNMQTVWTDGAMGSLDIEFDAVHNICQFSFGLGGNADNDCIQWVLYRYGETRDELSVLHEQLEDYPLTDARFSMSPVFNICDNTFECEANSAICTSAGQKCVDPNPSIDGDWYCACLSPTSGTRAVGKAAECTFDECDNHRWKCTDAGQLCVDTSPLTYNDWECVCAPSAETPGRQSEGPAACTPSGACAATADPCPGQICLNLISTFACQCPDPFTGTQENGLASCTPPDECVNNAVQCTTAGQECNDPSPDIGDWECKCRGSAFGNSTGSRAYCVMTGECAINGAICQLAGQECFDPDETTPNDWQCLCPAPSTGVLGLMGPATCEYDECITKGHACTDTGNLCSDPVKSISSVNDWSCSCVGSFDPDASTTPVIAGPANCIAVYDCVEFSSRCTSQGQQCVDADASTNFNYQCRCVSPSVGTFGTNGPSSDCGIDECTLNEGECIAAGQECVDPDNTKTGDWECRCIAPATGSAIVQKATCSYTGGECETNSKMCTDAGQVCVDVIPGRAGDWACACAPPSVGSLGRQQEAICFLDECLVHGEVCTDVGQVCVDQNQRTTGDFTCECAGSGSGSPAVGKPATCRFLSNGCKAAVCAAVGQVCTEDGTSYRCSCPPPSVGDSVLAAPATCIVDACVERITFVKQSGSNVLLPGTSGNAPVRGVALGSRLVALLLAVTLGNVLTRKYLVSAALKGRAVLTQTST